MPFFTERSFRYADAPGFCLVMSATLSYVTCELGIRVVEAVVLDCGSHVVLTGGALATLGREELLTARCFGVHFEPEGFGHRHASGLLRMPHTRITSASRSLASSSSDWIHSGWWIAAFAPPSRSRPTNARFSSSRNAMMSLMR